MNLQLHHVIGDITGLTGMTILEAILAGERNPHTLAGTTRWAGQGHRGYHRQVTGGRLSAASICSRSASRWQHFVITKS